ncbi:MAG: YihY/virulence factor BrkB family protein [Steroidobacteraceae bacterium]
MWLKFWNLLDRVFFGPHSAGPGPLALVVRVLRYPYAVVRDLSRGQINLRAMGLVFTTLMSLIPLIAFAFAILKVFGAHRDLEPIVYEFFRPVGGDSARDLTSRVMQFADRVSSGVVGSVGFALLLWTLLGTIKKVEDSFNFLWRVEQPRSFARRVAEYMSLLIVGPILLVGFIGLSHAALESEAVRRVVELPLLQRLFASLLEIAPYVMVSVFFTALYMFIPNTRVRILPAVIGGLAAGLLWAAVGKMFTAFVVFSTRLTIVYAGFAVIVAALLWTYFGWIILLAGAQLSFYVQNPSYLRLGLEELKLSASEHEQLALKVMYLVGQAHSSGRKRWTVHQLAAELGLAPIAIAEITDALERAGLLVVTDGDALVPGRDIGHIGLWEILDVARSERSGHLAPRAASVPAVERLSAKLDEARREMCGGRSLRDLLEESSQPTADSLQPG